MHRSFLVRLAPAVVALALLAGCAPKPTPRHHAAPVVTNDDDLRKITVDGRYIAVADTDNWVSELKYVAVLDLPAHFFVMPGKALLIGLGGGSVALNYRRMAWDVTVAEPDTARTALARTVFGLRDSAVRIVARPGRELLASDTARYDVILVDAVSSDDVPTELLTKEAFAQAALRMPETGILAVAIESDGWKDDVVASLSATLGEVFRQVIVLPISEPPNQFGSIVVIASNTVRGDLLRDPERNIDFNPEYRYGPEYQKAHAWDNHFTMETRPGSIQADDANRWRAILETLRRAAARAPEGYFP